MEAVRTVERKLLMMSGCLVVYNKKCHGQVATQVTGGCMYSREKNPDDERMSLKTC
jgi:hypothetical protein